MANLLADKTRRPSSALVFVLGAGLGLATACAADTPAAPNAEPDISAQLAGQASQAATGQATATLRRATARYHNLNAALADGFVFLHACEVRPGEGAVGTVYVHIGRLMDAVADASLPDALVYEPAANGREQPTLVAVEFAIPQALWPEPEPPRFLGAVFQPEEEFGVFGLHVWVWRNNPDGLFAEANPRVSCGDE